MANQQIIFDIDKDGKVAYEMQGYSGEACLDTASQIDKALGRVVNSGDSADRFKQTLNQNKVIYQQGA